MDDGQMAWVSEQVAKPAADAPHWSDKYLGRPYLRGEFDCADLVVEVMRAEFGREVALPRHAEGARARDRQIEELIGVLGRPLERGGDERPQDGDVALMKAAGRRLSLGHHIGVVAVLPLGVCVLHCVAGIGVVRHPWDSMAARNLELTGFYRWL